MTDVDKRSHWGYAVTVAAGDFTFQVGARGRCGADAASEAACYCWNRFDRAPRAPLSGRSPQHTPGSCADVMTDVTSPRRHEAPPLLPGQSERAIAPPGQSVRRPELETLARSHRHFYIVSSGRRDGRTVDADKVNACRSFWSAMHDLPSG